ncbi:MAG: hypothetical protein GY778_11830, partial [bacterium]|nr:hypothetical protein [bacterium]
GLARHVGGLACEEQPRLSLGNNLRRSLDEVGPGQLVAEQYNQAYDLARSAHRNGHSVELPEEF